MKSAAKKLGESFSFQEIYEYCPEPMQLSMQVLRKRIYRDFGPATLSPIYIF